MSFLLCTTSILPPPAAICAPTNQDATSTSTVANQVAVTMVLAESILDLCARSNINVSQLEQALPPMELVQMCHGQVELSPLLRSATARDTQRPQQMLLPLLDVIPSHTPSPLHTPPTPAAPLQVPPLSLLPLVVAARSPASPQSTPSKLPPPALAVDPPSLPQPPRQLLHCAVPRDLPSSPKAFAPLPRAKPLLPLRLPPPPLRVATL